METTNVSKKSLTRRAGISADTTVVLVAETTELHAKWGGKTLLQIGEMYDLSDEDVKIERNTAMVSGQEREIVSLALNIRGKWHRTPLSRAFNMANFDDASTLLKCTFRVTHKSVKNADGTPKQENGTTVIDESKPYMSFGNPSGITLGALEDVFAPIEGDDDFDGTK